MTSFRSKLPRLSRRSQMGASAALLIALGAAGGAGAVSLTRPAVEMAPTVPTAIAKLPASTGIVTVKGRIAEVYGDRFVMEDQSGRMMVDAGHNEAAIVGRGQAIVVQGRFDDGQLHASYLVGPDGAINAVGPARRGPHGPGSPVHGEHAKDGPPPPPPPGVPRLAQGNGAPPPPPVGAPPPGCGPAAAPRGDVPMSGNIAAPKASVQPR